MTSRELFEYCLKEYNNSNPITKYLINNFYNNLEEILKKFASENDKIFEIGCGAGESSERILNMLKESNLFEISEYDTRYIEMIRKFKPHLSVRQADVTNLRENDQQYDIVILLEVLEHLEDFRRALNEIFRISNKYVIISVPREPIWRLLNMIRFKYVKNFGNTPGHINHWTSRSFVTLLNEYGEVVSIMNPLPWTLLLVRKKSTTKHSNE